MWVFCLSVLIECSKTLAGTLADGASSHLTLISSNPIQDSVAGQDPDRSGPSRSHNRRTVPFVWADTSSVPLPDDDQNWEGFLTN